MLLNTVLILSGGGTQALQLIAGLSLLILLHEFGHFFFARLFKVRVEKFYLFFDFLFPFSGLLNFSLFKKKKGDTTYGIGWFPLGGYVKIAGMVDESMDKEALARPPEPWEYRSKKAWQRLLIMLGGIIMNVLVAMVLYMFIFGVWGEDYMPVNIARFGIHPDSTAEAAGFRNGDMLIGYDGKPAQRFNDVMLGVIFDNAKTVQITRDGKPMDVAIPRDVLGKILNSGQKSTFIDIRRPLVVDSVMPGSAADKMGVKGNDSVIAVNGQPIQFFDQFDSIKQTSAGKAIALTVVRQNQVVQLNGTLPADKLLGFLAMGPERFFKKAHITYNPIQAVGKGFTNTADKFHTYWQNFRLMFSGKVDLKKNLSGVYGFSKLASPVFEWQDFLSFVAFVSVILAFMNLLPIPGLDGGYVIFLMWEIITGRKVSEKVMERATAVGLVLLLALMVYANGLDILRHFKKA